MTPEQQRIAIAEACGWKHEIRESYRETPAWYRWGNDGACEMCDTPPDYLNDLNAMHQAEKVLDRVQRSVYVSNLGRMVTARGISDPVHFHMAYVCSTAAQRAEAFLRTLNLWKES